MGTIQETSFGAIPIRNIARKWEVFLVEHIDGHWGFPKGHSEKEETPFHAAIRELEEETSLHLKKLLRKQPFSERYLYQKKDRKILKEVFYFLMEVEGDVKIQKSELLDGGWFSFDEAHKKIIFPEGKNLLIHVREHLIEFFS